MSAYQYRRHYLRLAGQGPKRLNYREHGEAQAFYNWWLQMATYVWKVDPECLWHVPNESRDGGNKDSKDPEERAKWLKHVKRGKMLKAEGRVAGVLDYTLAIPRGDYHGFFFEFKALDGDEPTTKQKEMMARLAAQGYKTGCYHGAIAAENAVASYMKSESFTKALPLSA